MQDMSRKTCILLNTKAIKIAKLKLTKFKVSKISYSALSVKKKLSHLKAFSIVKYVSQRIESTIAKIAVKKDKRRNNGLIPWL